MYECRLTCNRCKYHKCEGVKYLPCKMIDHDKIQLKPSVFGGYAKSYDFNDICYFYEPAEYIKNPSFTNIEEYVKYLSEEWYEPSNFKKKVGINEVKQFRYVVLRIPSKDLEFHVPLYDWIMNTWKDGNKIKYKEVAKLVKNKKGEYYKREIIDRIDVKTDEIDINNFKWYDIGEI